MTDITNHPTAPAESGFSFHLGVDEVRALNVAWGLADLPPLLDVVAPADSTSAAAGSRSLVLRGLVDPAAPIDDQVAPPIRFAFGAMNESDVVLVADFLSVDDAWTGSWYVAGDLGVVHQLGRAGVHTIVVGPTSDVHESLRRLALATNPPEESIVADIEWTDLDEARRSFADSLDAHLDVAAGSDGRVLAWITLTEVDRRAGSALAGEAVLIEDVGWLGVFRDPAVDARATLQSEPAWTPAIEAAVALSADA
jgi:hypothetical protein